MSQNFISYISRRYFKRLLLSFLRISILPLGICVAAILYANYAMSLEKYTKNAETVSASYLHKLGEVVLEYENIAKSIGENNEIIQLLENNQIRDYGPSLTPIVESLMTGRENKIRIHILDYDSDRFQIGSQQKPGFYDTNLFSEWGILYELLTTDHGSVICSNPYLDENDRITSMSIGQSIRDKNDRVLGFVIIDVYRDTLVNLFALAAEGDTEVVLLDRRQIAILDTTGEYEEGKLTALGDRGLAVVKNSSDSNFFLYIYLNISDFYSSMSLLLKISGILLFICVLLCIPAASLLARSLYAPLGTLVESMESITQGNIQQRIVLNQNQNQNDEMVLLARIFNGMLDKMNDLLAQVVEETERQKNAEIKALQAQISPHFLYNMFNEIKSLAKLNRVDEISQFVVHLGRLLRRSITYKEGFGTVRDEIEFVKDYLELQQIRYERSFQIQIDIPEEVMACRIPTLILQPIVENSIIHGFTDGKKQHRIQITGWKSEDDKILFEVYDDGAGVDEDYMKYINNVEKSSGLYGGLGLENVQKRVLLTYGMEYGLKIESVKNQYTLVRITMPYSKETV